MHQLSALNRKRHYFIVSAVCAGMITVGVPSLAFATTSAELQAEADAALAQLNTMQASLVEAEDAYYTALDEQEAAQAAMDEAQANIDETNDQISDVQSKLSSRARSMYRSGTSSIIDLLLGSTSFKEFTTNWDLLTDLNNNDAEMVEQSKDLREQLEQEKATYAEQEQIASQKADEAKQVKEEAEAMVENIQAVYNSLSAEASALLQQEIASQEALNQANAAVVTQVTDPTTGETYYETTTNATSAGSTAATTSGSSSSVAYNAATGNSVVDRAYSWVGNAQYNFGDCSPGSFDCSGFVSYCLSGTYNRLGSTTTFQTWSSVSDPQPGDVCVSDGHCGIYIGNGQMIHASTYGVGVVVGNVQSDMSYVRYN